MASSTGAPRAGWYHGWNIVAVAVLAQIAANGLAINSMTLFLQDWSRDLHAPISQILLAMVPLAALCAVTSPIVGSFADKYPARWLLAAGLLGIAAFSLLMSMVTAVWQIWVLYGAVFPLSLTLSTSITANAVVSRWFVRRIGLALGITAFGLPVAGILLPPLIAAVTPAIGWRGVWRIAGLVTGAVILPLVLWIVRDKPDEHDGDFYLRADGAASAHRGHGHGHSHAGGAGALRWADILKRRNYWLLVACYLPVVALYGSVQQNLAPIIASHGFDPKSAGVLLPIFSVAGVIGTLAMGIVSDRFGNKIPLAALALMVAAGGVIVGYSSSMPALAVGAAVVGFTSGIWTLLPAAIALEFGAAGVGRAFGALMLFLPVNALVPALMAKVHESTGSYAPALAGVGIVCVLAAALMLLMREKRGGHLTAAEREAAIEEPVTPVP